MTKADEKAWKAWSAAASPEDLRYFEEVGAFPICSHCGSYMHFQEAPADKGLICCTNCDGGDTIQISG